MFSDVLHSYSALKIQLLDKFSIFYFDYFQYTSVRRATAQLINGF